MKIVVDILEQDYVYITKKHCLPSCDDRTLRKNFYEMVANGTPLQKGQWEHGKELCKEYRGRILVNVTYADWHCSNCNYVIKGTVKPKWNCCPNCGCHMVEPQESEGKE